MEGARSEQRVFHKLAESGLPKKMYWVVTCTSGCTVDKIIALKHEKRSDLHDMSPLMFLGIAFYVFLVL